ncbi:hypothetical protein ACE6H2_013958 [Prunus campanulata]
MDYPVSFEMNECFSLGDLEKQISVDPISLKESSNREVIVDPVVVKPDVTAPPVVTAPKANVLDQLPPLLPAKSKFLSFSLPNSATSSPRLKKKWKDESQASPQQQMENLTHLQQEIQFRRSKSCGQGRACAPSDDFDLWLIQPNATEKVTRHYSSLPIPEPHKVAHKNGKKLDPCDDKFTCGALCLFIPGFGKAKPVRARKVEPDELGNVISRTVSLEKFECGSWASAIINEHDDDSVSHYFDLPLELIRSSINDADSPISTSFVFDTDRKGVLKNGSSRTQGRKSHEASRHVRFSTSSSPTSPTICVTPRLRKARNDFKAFLEAQSLDE